MGTYYSLSLLNNIFCVSAYYDNYGNMLLRDRISGVISKGRNKYESSLIIGQEIDGKIYDILSGKEIMYSSIYDEPNPSLCYYSKRELSKEEVANEFKKFKAEDAKRYIEFISVIERESVENYQRYKSCIEKMSHTISLSKVI